MDTHEEVEWASEMVPDPDKLYLRVHRNLVPDGYLHPGVFRQQGGGMSTDWEKYSTPAQARGRATVPEANGVVELVAGKVREIEELSVIHTPNVERQNRAHTEVIGIETKHGMPPTVRRTAIRAQLFARFNVWLIEPDQA